MYAFLLRCTLFVTCLWAGSLPVYAEQVVLKVNVLQGDGFEDPKFDLLPLRKIIADGFARQNDTVWDTNILLENISDPDQLFFADLFVYQYAKGNPAISLTVRKGEKVYLLLNESKRILTTPKGTFESLAKNVAQQIPLYFFETLEYHPTVSDILKPPRDDFEVVRRGLSKTLSKEYYSQYQVTWDIEADTAANFYPYTDSFEEYFPYCLDLRGFRGKLKNKKFSVQIQISDLGEVTAVDFRLPVKLKSKQMDQLRNGLSALPLMVIRDWQPKKGTITVRVLEDS